MQLPADNSPIWPIARSVVVGSFLIGFLTLNYRNGWTAKDWNTLLGILAPMGAFDAIKHYLAGDKT